MSRRGAGARNLGHPRHRGHQCRGVRRDGALGGVAAESLARTTAALGRKLGAVVPGHAALADAHFQLRAHRAHPHPVQHVVPVEPGTAGRARPGPLELRRPLHVLRAGRKPGEPVVASAERGRGSLGRDLRTGRRGHRRVLSGPFADRQGSHLRHHAKPADLRRLQPVLRTDPRHRQLRPHRRAGGRAWRWARHSPSTSWSHPRCAGNGRASPGSRWRRCSCLATWQSVGNIPSLPNSPIPRSMQAQQLASAKRAMLQHRTDDAISQLQEIIEQQPKEAEPRYLLGEAYLFQHKPDQAIAAFQEALRLKPDYAEAEAALGSAYLDKGMKAGSGSRRSRRLQSWDTPGNRATICQRVSRYGEVS